LTRCASPLPPPLTLASLAQLDESPTKAAPASDAQPFSHFQISRPLPEGTLPSAATGHTELYDVTGVCGTRVSITLRPEIGDSDEFKPAAIKSTISACFETSQYSVVFSDR